MSDRAAAVTKRVRPSHNDQKLNWIQILILKTVSEDRHSEEVGGAEICIYQSSFGLMDDKTLIWCILPPTDHVWKRMNVDRDRCIHFIDRTTLLGICTAHKLHEGWELFLQTGGVEIFYSGKVSKQFVGYSRDQKSFWEVGMQINSMLAFGAIKFLFLQIEDSCQHGIASCWEYFPSSI